MKLIEKHEHPVTGIVTLTHLSEDGETVQVINDPAPIEPLEVTYAVVPPQVLVTEDGPVGPVIQVPTEKTKAAKKAEK